MISSLSDVHGRKPTLLISITGKIAGSILLLVNVQSGSVLLLVLSRVVDGLTNGVQPVNVLLISVYVRRSNDR